VPHYNEKKLQSTIVDTVVGLIVSLCSVCFDLPHQNFNMQRSLQKGHKQEPIDSVEIYEITKGCNVIGPFVRKPGMTFLQHPKVKKG
jgi:hypothetical protein